MSKKNRKSGATAKSAPPRTARQEPLALWPIFVAAVIVAAAIALLYSHIRATSAAPQPSPSVFAGDHYRSQGHQGHMPGDLKRFANFRYSSDPPTSGFHREIFSTAFVNTAPLPKYIQVHLLEHGNVLLQYSCLCPAIARQLADIADEFNLRLLPPGTTQPTRQQIQNAEEGGLAVVVAPYPTMSHTIALTAWTRLANLNSMDKANIVSFINQWLHNQDNLTQ